MSQSIREAVAAKIANSGPNVLEKVADLMADEVISKRIKQVHSAMTELDNANRDLRKLKPDLISYDINGAPIGEGGFSKRVIDDRKKITDRVAKIEKALGKAIESNDWSDLLNLGGGKDGAKPDGESS